MNKEEQLIANLEAGAKASRSMMEIISGDLNAHTELEHGGRLMIGKCKTEECDKLVRKRQVFSAALVEQEKELEVRKAGPVVKSYLTKTS